MKLADLEAYFLRREVKDEVRTFVNPDGSREERLGPVEYCITVEILDEAQGVTFVCPRCWVDKGNTPVGAHHMTCWFADRGVPADVTPKPGRWNPQGTGISDLTFVGPGSTSVLILGGCNAHFHIENGEIRFC